MAASFGRFSAKTCSHLILTARPRANYKAKMVTCLSESLIKETCYHFALIFAKLFTARRFSRKERFRKTLPLSTIFALFNENHHFHVFTRKWRLRWNVISSRKCKNRDFCAIPLLAVVNSRFSRKYHFWPLVARSKIDPATAAKKSEKKLYSGEFFLPEKFSTVIRYRSKNQHPTELKSPQKRAIFGPFVKPKLQLEADFWPKKLIFTKSVVKFDQITFVSALFDPTYVAIVTRPLFYSWRITVSLFLGP